MREQNAECAEHAANSANAALHLGEDFAVSADDSAETAAKLVMRLPLPRLLKSTPNPIPFHIVTGQGSNTRDARSGGFPHPPTTQCNGYEIAMGYILEEHLVTLFEV